MWQSNRNPAGLRSFETAKAVMAEDFLRRPEVKILLDWLQTRGLTLPSNPQDVQKDWSLPFMRWIVSETTNGVDAFLQPEDPPGVLISTHRDIVCDPALYNLTRVEAGRPTTHIVLGSNLAKKEWVKELMSLNKALFIDRNLSGRAALQQQLALSQNISDIVQGGGHVWIAQAPGRAKDGVDRTHPGLLRMLGLAFGGEKKGASALKNYIRPVAIRYDVNPCDARLVAERVRGEKPQGDDELSMLQGMEGWKGKVRIAEAPSVSLEGLTDRTSWGEAAKRVDDALDQCDISGQWSEAAKAALVDDAPLPESLTQRMEEVEQKIRAWMELEDTSLIRRATLEVYREGS
jgi:hypothetical protein